MLVFLIDNSRSLILPDNFFSPDSEIIFFLFVWWKQVCLPDHGVSDESIGLATGEFTASDQSSVLETVGIYDEELWWQRDRWERCLWPWGFSLTTMKRIEGKKSVLVLHNKNNGFGREGWKELGLNESLLHAGGIWVVHLLQTKHFLIFTTRTAGKEGNEENLVISWKKQINNFGVVWLWLNSKYE